MKTIGCRGHYVRKIIMRVLGKVTLLQLPDTYIRWWSSEDTCFPMSFQDERFLVCVCKLESLCLHAPHLRSLYVVPASRTKKQTGSCFVVGCLLYLVSCTRRTLFAPYMETRTFSRVKGSRDQTRWASLEVCANFLYIYMHPNSRTEFSKRYFANLECWLSENKQHAAKWRDLRGYRIVEIAKSRGDTRSNSI